MSDESVRRRLKAQSTPPEKPQPQPDKFIEELAARHVDETTVAIYAVLLDMNKHLASIAEDLEELVGKVREGDAE